MRRPWILAAAGLLAAPALAEAPGPIAPAAQGRLQCFEPDTARKTCKSIAAYQISANGTIDSLSVNLLAKQPVVTMVTRATVRVKGQQVCDVGRTAELETAAFTVAGHPATESQTAMLRNRMLAAYAPLIGRDVCLAFQGDGLGRVSVDGVRRAEMDKRVIWISRGDGYTVGP